MKKIMMILAAAIAAATLISCDKYEDGRPDRSVRNQFDKMYPGAFDIEWEWEGTFWEVSFETGSRPNGTEREARYAEDGTWIRTKTEMFLTSVPQQIKDFLAADPTYGNAPYADNEIDFIETPAGDFYRFDLRVNGAVVEVDVTTDGEVKLAGYDY